ncbi:MAG: methyltransferase [Gammaproteobacteria bacterium]|nr:methyltransferase [Gammaproteobacteria bacterium]
MSQPRVDTVRLQKMVRAYRESGALMAAVELGLFSKLAQGADTEASLIEALGIQPVNAERIVIACIGLGLVERDGERLKNAPDVARFLVEGEPGYAGAWMLFTKPDWNEWGRLSEHLRNPASPVVENKTVAGISLEEARRYHRATYSIGMGAGRRFVRQVDLSGRQKMMDLGGGSGAYCIQACQKWSQLRAVVCDLPAVAAVARDFIAENGMHHKVSAIECDFVNDPLPTDADVAVMASNLPMYGREVIAAVVKKAHDALLPGGEFHLIGEALNAERDGPADAALWGLAQTLNNTTGLAHSVSECEQYLRAAGFTQVASSDFVPGVLIRTSGRKAG